jgi:hypothetical protein
MRYLSGNDLSSHEARQHTASITISDRSGRQAAVNRLFLLQTDRFSSNNVTCLFDPARLPMLCKSFSKMRHHDGEDEFIHIHNKERFSQPEAIHHQSKFSIDPGLFHVFLA